MAQEMKIGFVNVAKVFDGYRRTQASDATLEKKGKQKEAELQARLDELKKMRESLELLSPDAREPKERVVEEKADELQRFRTATARELRRERDRIAREILQDIDQTIKAFAAANGFALIMDERALLFGQKAADVTDAVLGTLNQQGGAAPGPAKPMPAKPGAKSP
jgi:outer membrane protein